MRRRVLESSILIICGYGMRNQLSDDGTSERLSERVLSLTKSSSPVVDQGKELRLGAVEYQPRPESVSGIILNPPEEEHQARIFSKQQPR